MAELAGGKMMIMWTVNEFGVDGFACELADLGSTMELIRGMDEWWWTNYIKLFMAAAIDELVVDCMCTLVREVEGVIVVVQREHELLETCNSGGWLIDDA